MRKMLKPEKKTYEAPRLVRYGNATILVKGSSTCQYETGGGRKYCPPNC